MYLYIDAHTHSIRANVYKCKYHKIIMKVIIIIVIIIMMIIIIIIIIIIGR